MTARAPGRPARLRGVDAARGVALVGMMAVHVLPSVDLDGSPSVAHQVAGGRSAATFAVLAGVGLALATARLAPSGARGWAGVAAGLAVRALAIGAIGLALGYPDSGLAVILAYYAVFFVVAIPLLPLRPGVLAGISLATAVLVPVASHAVRAELALQPGLRDSPTFDTLLHQPLELVVGILLTGYYPVLAWIAYLAAGLAAGKLALRSPRVATGLLVGGVALAAAASLGSWALLDALGGRDQIAATFPLGTTPAELDHELGANQFGTTPTTTWWWLAVDAPHASTPPDLLHTTGSALALLGATLLIARAAAWALIPLAAAGAMTLTLYSTHVTALAWPGLPANPLDSYTLQVAAVLAIATVWWLVRSRGPLEATIAKLSTLTRRAIQGRPSSRLSPTPERATQR